jgi:hypothetical protein
MGNLVGRSLAHFRIEAELGERGMGIHPLSSARRWAGKLLLVFLLSSSCRPASESHPACPAQGSPPAGWHLYRLRPQGMGLSQKIQVYYTGLFVSESDRVDTFLSPADLTRVAEIIGAMCRAGEFHRLARPSRPAPFPDYMPSEFNVTYGGVTFDVRTVTSEYRTLETIFDRYIADHRRRLDR